jgi:predicted phage-related endonuclease
MQTWSPPITLPNLCPEYAAISLEPVAPIPSYILNAYARYLAKKDELLAEKSTLTKKVATLEEKVNQRDGKYRPQGVDDPVIKGMRDDIVRETAILKGIENKIDALAEDNRAVEEYMVIHKKMEESYVTTKELQQQSRLSWAALYSSV